MVTPTRGWILWAGTTGFEGSLDERLEAAASSGYGRVSVSPADIERAETSGVSLAEVRRAAKRHGIRWVLDPVVTWLPPAADADGTFAKRARHWERFSVAENLRFAEGIDAVSFSAVAMTLDPHDTEMMTAAFADLCDAAADIGVDAHLEFVPMTVVANVAIAWDIVRMADRPNGGMLFDTWHFFRGDPDFEALAQVPGDRVFTVQVSDAAAESLPSMWSDTFHRKLPGDGALDLARALGVLEQSGGLQWVGPEIFSPELQALDPRVAAQIAKDRIAAI